MKSIKSKIFIYFMVFTAILMLINLSITDRTLEKYLIYSNVNTIDNFLTKENIASENTLSETNLDAFSEKYNAIITVIDNGKVLYTSASSMGNSQGFLHNMNFKDSISYEIRKMSKFSFDFLIATKKVDDYNMLVQFPLNFIVHQIETIQNVLNLVAAFIFVLGLVFSFFISTIVSKPIVEVEKTAKKISQLDFSDKLPETRKDEFGSLNKSINSMGNELNKTISELEKAKGQLIKDIDLLNNNEKLRKQLFSDFSHELKTPVALIQGYSEMIMKKALLDDPSLEKYMNTIIFECERLDYLTKEILSLSDLESHNFKLKYSKVNISELLSNTVESFEETLKDYSLTLDISPDIIIDCDKNRTSTVINNLISNSIDHNNNQKEISISLKNNESDIILEIYNTGEKIDEQSLEKLWLNFFKLDKSRNRKFGGSGLGLSIVSKIIELHAWEKSISNYKDGILVSIKIINKEADDL
ncbi:MAG: HAMP domain-containing histidine kinase [Firmicutes bacterium]|nr:HAMP domain-containing histidine kinase [Bacillota bacterium]